MTNNKQLNQLYNEISYLKIIINEMSEYIKTKNNEEISFRLACTKKSLNDEEITKLFLIFSNETEKITDKKLINKNKLINLSKKNIKKLENTKDFEIEILINSFINCYFLRKDDI